MRSSLSAVAHTIILTWTSSRALVFPNCTHLCWLCCLCPSPAHSPPSRVPRGQRLQAAAPGPRPWLSSRREVAAGLSWAPPVPVPAWRSGVAFWLGQVPLRSPSGSPAPCSRLSLGSRIPIFLPCSFRPRCGTAAHCIWSLGASTSLVAPSPCLKHPLH